MSRRRVFGCLVVAVLINIALVWAAENAVFGRVALTSAVDAQDRLVHRGGIIRVGSQANRDEAAFDAAVIKIASTGIYLHDNSTHASVGITGLTLSAGCDLIIWTDDDATEEVVSIVIEEDESLARLDIESGPSGGGGKTTVPLYKNGAKVCATSSTFGSQANLWVGFTHLKDAS
jgi:hypothetical protein